VQFKSETLVKVNTKTLLRLTVVLVGMSCQAIGSTILDGWAFNIDGQAVSFMNYDPAQNADIAQTVTLPGGTVAVVRSSLFDAGTIDWSGGQYQTAGGTGLGLVTVEITGLSNETHTVTLWLDHELSQSDVYFTEFGSSVGTLAGNTDGITDYGIDDPGYMGGTLYFDVMSGGSLSKTLDGSLGSVDPADVSLALQLTSQLPTGHAMFSFLTQYSGLDYESPNFSAPSGFHLEQTSNNGGGTLYYSASVTNVSDSPATVPEPGTWVLMGGGMLLLSVRRFGRKQN